MVNDQWSMINAFPQIRCRSRDTLIFAELLLRKIIESVTMSTNHTSPKESFGQDDGFKGVTVDFSTRHRIQFKRIYLPFIILSL